MASPVVATSVDQLYADILGRAPEQSGAAYWNAQFGNEIDANEMQAFKNSAQTELNARNPAPTPAAPVIPAGSAGAGLQGTGSIQLRPDYVTGPTQDYGNTLGGALSQIQGVYKDWYANPLTTGVSPEMQNYYNQMSTPNNQWINATTQASQMAQQGATYDPAEMQKHLNPYLNQATNDIYSAANRNLNENLMPNVNSTFTGAGQFGSTRNADFAGRALRDTQEAAAKAAGQLQLQGWGQAATDYSNWGQLGQTGAQNLGGLAKTGMGLDQQNLQNLGTAATGQQQLEQQSLTATYDDWLKRQQFPSGALAQMSSPLGSLGNTGGYNTFTTGGTSQAPQADTTTKIIAALQNIGNVFGSNY